MSVSSTDSAMTTWCVQVCWTFFIVSWLTARRLSTLSKNSTSEQLSLWLINTAEIQRSVSSRQTTKRNISPRPNMLPNAPDTRSKNLCKKLIQVDLALGQETCTSDMLSCAGFFSGISFFHWIKFRSIPRRFVQVLAWTCVRILFNKLTQVSGTSFL